MNGQSGPSNPPLPPQSGPDRRCSHSSSPTMSALATPEWERSATKRCSSPTRRESDPAKRGRGRRREEALLLVLQRQMMLRDLCHDSDTQTTDLIGSFGETSEGETVVGVEWLRGDTSLPTPTLAMVGTDILGSLDSRSVEVGTPLEWLASSGLWSTSCSSRLSCTSSPGTSVLSCSLEEAQPPPSCSRTSLATCSSSYTSWTQPVKGRQQSDSCVPASSILDMLEQELEARSRGLSRSKRRSRSLGQVMVRVRDRSADTSKDISEIDDFEIDALEDQFEFELPDDDDVEVASSWVVVSPDLAYCSMEPSLQAKDLAS